MAPPSSVGPVPGRPVPRHGRARPRSGGRGVVRRQKRRPHPDLTQRRLRLHEEPRPESGQDQRPGDQAGAQSRTHPDCAEARLSAALRSERKRKDASHFLLYAHHFSHWRKLFTLAAASSRKKCCHSAFFVDSIFRSHYYGWNNLAKLWISTYFGTQVVTRWIGRGKIYPVSPWQDFFFFLKQRIVSC